MHLNPLKVLHTLEDIMTDNTILVADGGDFVATAAYILRLVSCISPFLGGFVFVLIVVFDIMIFVKPEFDIERKFKTYLVMMLDKDCHSGYTKKVFAKIYFL